MIAGSSPSSDGSTILTAPLEMTNSESPGSPWWKIVSPLRNRRTRIAAASASSVASSALPNSPQAAERLSRDRIRRARSSDLPVSFQNCILRGATRFGGRLP